MQELNVLSARTSYSIVLEVWRILPRPFSRLRSLPVEALSLLIVDLLIR